MGEELLQLQLGSTAAWTPISIMRSAIYISKESLNTASMGEISNFLQVIRARTNELFVIVKILYNMPMERKRS